MKQLIGKIASIAGVGTCLMALAAPAANADPPYTGTGGPNSPFLGQCDDGSISADGADCTVTYDPVTLQGGYGHNLGYYRCAVDRPFLRNTRTGPDQARGVTFEKPDAIRVTVPGPTYQQVGDSRMAVGNGEGEVLNTQFTSNTYRVKLLCTANRGSSYTAGF